MTVGLIGLGKMGSAIAERLINAGHQVVAFDINEDARSNARDLGAATVDSVDGVAQQTDIIWLMIPPGDIIDAVIDELIPNLPENSIIIDGGNSKFTDSIKRAEKLKSHSIFFLDCGTSGGLCGRRTGFSLMIGGQQQAFDKIIPVFKAIAAPEGFGLVGPSGAGHYVKMVHNGIEYALLQAYAEGFNLLKNGRYKNLDLEQISELWLHGSVIRSFILELCHNIFEKDQEFKTISGKVGSTGMGAWTVQEAKEQKVSVKLIEDALQIRNLSQESGGDYATKIVALLREQFGGHKVDRAPDHTERISSE